jgi:pantoate--beta-alanine ligase
VRIDSCPTVREADGLAMSSRNSYLTATQRPIAPALQETLRGMARAIEGGSTSFAELEAQAGARLAGLGFRPDYVSVRNADTLEPASTADWHLVILAAAWLGRPRLLDNVEVTLPANLGVAPPPTGIG